MWRNDDYMDAEVDTLRDGSDWEEDASGESWPLVSASPGASLLGFELSTRVALLGTVSGVYAGGGFEGAAAAVAGS